MHKVRNHLHGNGLQFSDIVMLWHSFGKKYLKIKCLGENVAKTRFSCIADVNSWSTKLIKLKKVRYLGDVVFMQF